MVPFIMCNAPNINLIIISKSSAGYDVMTVNPRDKPGVKIPHPHVILIKCDEHYDACIRCFDVDMNSPTHITEPKMSPACRYYEYQPADAVSALADKACTTDINRSCTSANTLVANRCTTAYDTSEFQHDVFKSLLSQCGGFLRFLNVFSFVYPTTDDEIIDGTNTGYFISEQNTQKIYYVDT